MLGLPLTLRDGTIQHVFMNQSLFSKGGGEEVLQQKNVENRAKKNL